MFRQIEAFGGTLHHEKHDLAHPIALASSSWTAVERALNRAIIDFSTVLAGRFKPGNPEYAVALDSHAALIGRAAEFIETLTENVASAFVVPGEKLRISHVKKERRHIDVICNKLKHNQNFLAPVTATANDGRIAYGFSVYSIDAKGEQHPNPEIHKQAEAFSLPLEIRRTIVDCYVISERVSEFVEQYGSINLYSMETPALEDGQRLDLFKRVSELPKTCFPFEKGPFPVVGVEGSELTIRPSGGDAERLPHNVTMVVSGTPYLGALKIKVPL